MKNFNYAPYYDDFDSSKNFHRVLFKPGVAVQARELTQSQSILQNQITSFADNIFKRNSPVSGGKITINNTCRYVKVNTTYEGVPIDVNNFLGLTVTNEAKTISAKVVAVFEGNAEEDEEPLLILSYITPQTKGFNNSNNRIIYCKDPEYNFVAEVSANQPSPTNTTLGFSTVASISNGIFYVKGCFVYIAATTIIVEKYTNKASKRIGFIITEDVYDYIDDLSLLDPALGASNYQAPGADRYVIKLELSSKPISYDAGEDDFVELVRIDNGIVQNILQDSQYNLIDEYISKRDYETNGNYVVEDFSITTSKNDSNEATYNISIGPGVAYVEGKRLENPGTITLVGNRARDTISTNNKAVSDTASESSYFYVDSVGGNTSTFFDFPSMKTVDLHMVNSANVNYLTANSYNSTLAAQGYITNFYCHSNTIYKIFVNEIQSKFLTGYTVSSTANTIVLANTTINNDVISSSNNAYDGVTIAIIEGTNQGEYRRITAYSGADKTATIDRVWSINPDMTSKFSLNFDVKDCESIIYADSTSSPVLRKANCNINILSRSKNIATNDAELQNPNKPEFIYKIDNYIADISDGSYETTHQFTGITFSPSAVLNLTAYDGNIVFFSTTLDDYIIITSTGEIYKPSSTPVISSDGKSCTVDIGTTKTGCTVIVKAQVSNANVPNSTTKVKNLVLGIIDYTSSTPLPVLTPVTGDSYTSYSSTAGHVYIEYAGLLGVGIPQSLFVSDVKSIKKIIDTKSSLVEPAYYMFSDDSYNVTNRYLFNDGQRDTYYDHASITLKEGFAPPTGNLLVVIDYYEHSGNEGFFSKRSYIDDATSKDDYRIIPIYVSTKGNFYFLRDCLDFRRVRTNWNATVLFNGTNPHLPIDTFTTDCSRYLKRFDRLILTKDKTFKLLEGKSADAPNFPNEPEGSLILANFKHNPYTSYIPNELDASYIPDLTIEKRQYKRYTMQDIAGLENRINQVEYYTALSAIEQSATRMQIPDAYGLNRFKNGILTDDFSSFLTADTYNAEYFASINRRLRTLSPPQTITNIPLKNLYMIYTGGNLTSVAQDSLSYKIHKDNNVQYYTLPYTANTGFIVQPIATANFNDSGNELVDITDKITPHDFPLNPFAVSTTKGLLQVSPNYDCWVDSQVTPGLTLGVGAIYQSTPGQMNVLQWGDWRTVSGTTALTGQTTTTTDTIIASYQNHGNFYNTYIANLTAAQRYSVGYSEHLVKTQTTSTYESTYTQTQSNILGPYSILNNTYALNNEYVQDISIQPYIREQDVAISAFGLKPNADLINYFDGKVVDKYIKKPNVIEISKGGENFDYGDIIGYYTPTNSSEFWPMATVIGKSIVTTETANVGYLYVTGDGWCRRCPVNTSYSNTSTTNYRTIYKAQYNTDGTIVPSYSNKYVGEYVTSNTVHNSGMIWNVDTVNTSVQLSTLATANITGNTLYVVTGTPVQSNVYSATILSYDIANNIAVLNRNITGCKAGDLYSLNNDKFPVDKYGTYSALFRIPPNTFNTGERVFRVDDGGGSNEDSSTWAEGKFYAQGLYAKKTTLDFISGSPSGLKDAITQTNSRTFTIKSEGTTTQEYKYYCPYDPIAQSFMIDSKSYPEGVFLYSIRVFFKNKPKEGGENTDVTLSVVGTLAGIPEGNSLDHSVVVKKWNEIKCPTASYSYTETDNGLYWENDDYATEFKFSLPVYIKPDQLYAFILKSGNSDYKVYGAKKELGIEGATDEIIIPSTIKLSLNPGSAPVSMSTAPFVGGLFESQNAITWVADPNQSLMFSISKCDFDISQTPSVRFIVPAGFPQRTLIEDTIRYVVNYDNIENANTTYPVANTDILYDAFNVTSTDYVPPSATVRYEYSTLNKNLQYEVPKSITPGKYGTAMYNDICLDDRSGQRLLLQSNNRISFTLDAILSSTSKHITPIVSDAGTSLYVLQNNVNNCELSNSNIKIESAGSGYNVSSAIVTVSSPSTYAKNSELATAGITVSSSGAIESVYIINGGSGYIEDATITVSDPTTRSGNSNCSISIVGETSPKGGTAMAKYFTKMVSLNEGFDSEDLSVFITAYRPYGTDIHVYYKIRNRYDTEEFDTANWQLMTKIKNCDSVYSGNRSQFFEYSFAPGTAGIDQGYVKYTNKNGVEFNPATFNNFALKVILTSNDPTFVPILSDLRCIALPSNLDLTTSNV